MPTYEYQCGGCHEPFEVRASFQEKEAGLQPVCPRCGQASDRQNISGGLLIRVGAGDQELGCACGPRGGPGCCG